MREDLLEEPNEGSVHFSLHPLEDSLKIFVVENLSHLQRVALEFPYDENHGRESFLH